MKPPPRVSVIVRARNEAASLPRCLIGLGEQRINGSSHEVIVVDSGSTDATVEVALAHGARVVHLPATDFTFGGALNLGCANARGAVLVALSADAYPGDPGWLERLLEPLRDPSVACASGDRYGPSGDPLRARVDQDAALARRHPEWGYSNAAGAFRAELWRRRPFRIDLPGCEDKEWALHWLERKYVCAIDPAAVVEHSHAHDPVLSIYGRARREWEGLGAFIELSPYGPRELIGDWWGDLRWYPSPLRARLSHRRAARLLGTYAGRRRAVRRRVGRRRARTSARGS
jgi:rhamnosyltransferase